MSTIKEEYAVIIDILKEAKEKLDLLNHPELITLRARLKSEFSRNINSMSQQIGLKVVGELERVRSQPGEPLLKMFGREIVQNQAPKEEKLKDTSLTPSAFKKLNQKLNEDAEYEAFEKKVSELYDSIGEMDEDKVLDSVDDITLRGVARIAGLPVTELVPKVIDKKYLKIIKDAVKKQKDATVKTTSSAPVIDPVTL